MFIRNSLFKIDLFCTMCFEKWNWLLFCCWAVIGLLTLSIWVYCGSKFQYLVHFYWLQFIIFFHFSIQFRLRYKLYKYCTVLAKFFRGSFFSYKASFYFILMNARRTPRTLCAQSACVWKKNKNVGPTN